MGGGEKARDKVSRWRLGPVQGGSWDLSGPSLERAEWVLSAEWVSKLGLYIQRCILTFFNFKDAFFCIDYDWYFWSKAENETARSLYNRGFDDNRLLPWSSDLNIKICNESHRWLVGPELSPQTLIREGGLCCRTGPCTLRRKKRHGKQAQFIPANGSGGSQHLFPILTVKTPALPHFSLDYLCSFQKQRQLIVLGIIQMKVPLRKIHDTSKEQKYQEEWDMGNLYQGSRPDRASGTGI